MQTGDGLRLQATKSLGEQLVMIISRFRCRTFTIRRRTAELILRRPFRFTAQKVAAAAPAANPRLTDRVLAYSTILNPSWNRRMCFSWVAQDDSFITIAASIEKRRHIQRYVCVRLKTTRRRVIS
jgi:hypothetical protein